MDILAAVEECHRQERIERDASTAAADSDARDRHFMNAERHADQAWSLMQKLHDLNAVEYASTQPAAPPIATTE